LSRQRTVTPAEEFDVARKERITVLILKDVLDGIEHCFGVNGLNAVADFARARNRARESNDLIDQLETLYGPLAADEASTVSDDRSQANAGEVVR
jgi:hypothetical protein